MAMYVLLSFDDDELAKDLVDVILNSPEANQFGKVEGIYKKPTIFCDRTNTIHGSSRITGWTKGQKWGWWVCMVCKKPSPVAAMNLPNEVSGFNLLDRLFPKRDIDFESGKNLSQREGSNSSVI